MDIKRINTIIKHLSKVDCDTFNMNHYYSNISQPYREKENEQPDFNICGTFGCIAGHVCSIVSSEEFNKEIQHDIRNNNLGYYRLAKNWLRLTELEAASLFTPSIYVLSGNNYESLSVADAIKALENLRDGIDIDKIWLHVGIKEDY